MNLDRKLCASTVEETKSKIIWASLDKIIIWPRGVLTFLHLPHFSSLGTLFSNCTMSSCWRRPPHSHSSHTLASTVGQLKFRFLSLRPFCFETALCAQVDFWVRRPLLHSGPLLSNAARKRSPADRGQKYTQGCWLFWTAVFQCTVRFLSESLHWTSISVLVLNKF